MSFSFKPILASLFASIILACPLLQPVSVYAQQQANIVENLKKGACLNVTDTCGDFDASGSADKLNQVIAKIINTLSIIVGVVAVIMIIIGGFKYIMSGGDSSNVSGAKNTILYAIIGIIIVALAQVIVRFVLSSISSAAIQ